MKVMKIASWQIIQHTLTRPHVSNIAMIQFEGIGIVHLYTVDIH